MTKPGQRGQCRGCGAAILWIQTPAGKRTPIDAIPLTGWAYSAEWGAWRLIEVHVSHFATCPQAEQFRKKK